MKISVLLMMVFPEEAECGFYLALT